MTSLRTRAKPTAEVAEFLSKKTSITQKDVNLDALANGPWYPLSGEMKQPKITGNVAPGFEDTKLVFTQQLQQGWNVGASFALLSNGKPLVDLSGGWKTLERRTPFDNTTLVQVFSSSKAVTSIVIAHMVSLNLIDVDKPVAYYWPEFGCNGKEKVTVTQLLQHRGGVGWLDKENSLSAQELLENDPMVAVKLARQPHNYNSVETSCYHGTTRGWYLNEIVKRVTKGKFTIGSWLQTNIIPLLPKGTEIYCGSLPSSTQGRVADLIPYPDVRVSLRLKFPQFVPEGKIPPFPMDPKHPNNLFPLAGPKHTIKDITKYNTPECRNHEGPSYNMHSNARSLANLGALIANNGTSPYPHSQGKQLIDANAMKMLTTLVSSQIDKALEGDLRVTRGGVARLDDTLVPFLVRDPVTGSTETRPEWKRPGMMWLMWSGLGGSTCAFSPTHKLSLSFVMNGLILPGPDPRCIDLIASSLLSWERMNKL